MFLNSKALDDPFLLGNQTNLKTHSQKLLFPISQMTGKPREEQV